MAGVRVSRRGALGVTLGGVTLGGGLFPAIVRAQGTAGRFTHNVASGDPLATRVILWTRYVPDGGGRATVRWQVAEDERFDTIVAQGTSNTGPERDYTVKVDAAGLMPGRWYAYRFLVGDVVSPVGRTRTLPVGAVDRLGLALFSCSNLPFGHFHAYADAAARGDLELAMHVGDYIYEYEQGKYPSKDQVLDGRPPLEPAGEIIKLADYRARYGVYRTDPDLQAVHNRLPFLCVWDDHELANDTWRNGAEEHQPEREGPWPVRFKSAEQAYFEWMPIRGRPGKPIHRRFDVGQLATLLMLDTRVEGRDQQFSYLTALKTPADATPEQFAAACAAFRDGPLADPRRTLLGLPQERWLSRELKRSTERGIAWQVLGQQIQMGRMSVPAGVSPALSPTLNERARQYVRFGVMVGQHGLPANLDAWGGYPAARQRVLEAIVAAKASAVVLGGDTHNAWAFELRDDRIAGAPSDRPIAVEFDTHAVTSPGFESLLVDAPAGAAALVAGNPELKWCNLKDRGYTALTFTPDSVTADFRVVTSIREKTGGIAATVSARANRVSGGGVTGLTIS
jgi:alkaline phosphatase D